MKAVLEYTDHLISRDGKQVLKILAEHNIEIIKTKKDYWTYDRKITIRIKDHDELNLLLAELNKYCVDGVRLVKVRRDGIFSRPRRNSNEERV